MDRRRTTLVLTVVCFLGMIAPVTAAQPEHDLSGVVSMVTTSVGLDIGVEWGSGILTLVNGQQYRFAVKGLMIGSAGAGKTLAHGTVYHLHAIDDFAGTYGAVEAGFTVMEGMGGVAMRNQHGVVLVLSTVERGVQLTLAAEGVEIKLQEKRAEE
jgi:hypothetical protein